MILVPMEYHLPEVPLTLPHYLNIAICLMLKILSHYLPPNGLSDVAELSLVRCKIISANDNLVLLVNKANCFCKRICIVEFGTILHLLVHVVSSSSTVLPSVMKLLLS